MKHWIESLVDITALNCSSGMLLEALKALSLKAGFEQFAFFHIGHGPSHAISNYNQDWQDKYFRHNYSEIDPVIERARIFKRAFTWSLEDDQSWINQRQKDMYYVSAEFGIRSGVTIPIRTPNKSLTLFTVSCGRPRLQLKSAIDAVAAASAVGQLHSKLSTLETRQTSKERIDFSPSEIKYLRWIGAGKTVSEIAIIEGVTYNSVRVCLSRAKKRTGIYNITQLAVFAAKNDLI